MQNNSIAHACEIKNCALMTNNSITYVCKIKTLRTYDK